MIKSVSIREPNLADEYNFLKNMHESSTLHTPWTKAPTTTKAFIEYIHKYQQPNNKSYLVMSEDDEIAGVFNISEMVRGVFQNAFLGYYGVIAFNGKGYMSAGFKLVIKKVFTELALHRLEANIQPENTSSINLVKANGFRKEGYSPRYLKINEEWRDHERWAITYEDWQNNTK